MTVLPERPNPLQAQSLPPEAPPPGGEALPLLPHHLAQLTQGSGLSPESIRARGYRSVTSKAELKRLGFGEYQRRVPALLVPVWTVHGEIGNYQLRPDQPRIDKKRGKPRKYETLVDSRMVVDVPPRSRAPLGNPQLPLWVTEGAKKADALADRGCCAIDLLGVWNWRGTNDQGGKTVLADFEAIALNERQVYLVFDSDVMVKREVYGALARFGAWLDRRGAHVAYVYLPATAGGAKQGVDDVLAAGGTVDDLLARATTEPRQPPGGGDEDDAPGTSASRLAEHIADQWREDDDAPVLFDTTRQRWMGYGVRHPGVWSPMVEQAIQAHVRVALAERLPEGFSWALLQGVERLLRTLLQGELPEPSRDWLPLRNGALHLPTRRLHPHSPEYGWTWCLPFAYDPDATCPAIDAWLSEAQDGDPARVRLLRAYLRATVLGRTDLQRFVELVGPGGSGKGTYLRVAMALVGLENTHVTELRELEGNRFETSNIVGKRLVVITDADRHGGPINRLKALTGGDPLRSERKYDPESRSFTPEAMVVVAANEEIQSSDYTSGLERRRITVPFRHRPATPRPLLAFRRGEASGPFVPELPGLLNAVLAIGDAEMEDLLCRTTQAVPALREAWVASLVESNGLALWAHECLVYAPEARTSVGVAERDPLTEGYQRVDEWLYANYSAFAEAAGEGRRRISLVRFGRLLEDLCRYQLKLPAVARGRDKDGAHVTGIRLRTPVDRDRERPGFITQALETQETRASPAPKAQRWGQPLDGDEDDGQVTVQPVENDEVDGFDGFLKSQQHVTGHPPPPGNGMAKTGGGDQGVYKRVGQTRQTRHLHHPQGFEATPHPSHPSQNGAGTYRRGGPRNSWPFGRPPNGHHRRRT